MTLPHTRQNLIRLNAHLRQVLAEAADGHWRYRPGHSDNTAAELLGVKPKWVYKHRLSLYGPLASDPRTLVPAASPPYVSEPGKRGGGLSRWHVEGMPDIGGTLATLQGSVARTKQLMNEARTQLRSEQTRLNERVDRLEQIVKQLDHTVQQLTHGE